MPTYDYECDACGHTMEVFQNISEDVLTKCPQCKRKKLRRLFGTGGGILFKGSGFYSTDYRSDSYKKKAASDSSSASSGESKSTDSKSSESKSSDSKSSSSSSSSAKSDGGSK